jgi:hypothetical protein
MRKFITIAVLFAALPLIAQSAFPNLLTGQTPRTLVVPSGWTSTATEDFENGTCNTGAWCGGNFNSIQYHNDGNPAHTHSLGCTYGNQLQTQDSTHAGDCGGFNWNKFLPVGTRQVYISFYTYLDTSFRMNDEFFLLRFHWDTGNGQPAFRENVVDYFQNSTGTYNSTNATLLNNIQGQPYYQNKLPSNTPSDSTNFTPITGTFANQVEYYAKYSTVTPSKTLSSGTVTLNAAAHSYTRASGSWINDGVLVGSSPHFTGFSSSPNNNDGSAGGGGYSLFVTAVSDLVMTVNASPYITNDTATNPDMQLDNGDGAYAMYVNGVLQGFQNNMVFPGKYDFSTSNTTLSLMESYSKLIWRAPVNGNCEQQSAPPPAFTGTCAAGIGGTYSPGGCGFERMDFGWNASGFTRLSGGSTPYTVPIDCAPSPMPNPPVFDRYLDDVIVLTQSGTSTPTPVQAATLTASTDACSNPQQTVSFPGYSKYTLNAGTVANCGSGGNTNSSFSSQGITSYFDLKNDPNATQNLGAADTGMFEHQWGIKNQDGTTRYNEIKEGPMAITVTESNNVRVKLSQSGAVRSVGNLGNTADCCMTMTKSYVFYRHGGVTTGSGASKVYTKTTINYDNGDGQAPLTTAGTSTGINYYNKIGWWKVTGEYNGQTNFIGPCFGSSGLATFTSSPWNMVYQVPGTNANKDYILFAPVAANSATSGEFLQANGCVSPGGSQQGPTPTQTYICNTPTTSGCASQTANSVLVRAGFMQIEQEQTGNYMNLASLAPYFSGGLRVYAALANQTFPANTPRSWSSVGFIGDNGITSEGSATPYVTEYKTPPTITFVTGSTAAFDSTEGYWTMTAATNAVSFSANGVLHSPAFSIASFSSSAPSQISVGGVTLVKDTGYVAVKTDSTHLLLQVLSDVSSGTNISINGGAPSVVVSPSTVTIPKSGTTQFSSSVNGATWTVDGACHGSIASTGIFTASSTAETCTVTATSGGNIGTATVTSQALTVTPATVAMNVGGTQQFTSNFASTWSATGGTINGSGLYTAPSLNGTYTITATALNGGTTGTATATVTGQVTLIPLVTSPTSWNYGTVTISTTVNKQFTISNIGTGTVTISTQSITAGASQFSINTNTCGGTIAGGASCTFNVAFTSAAAGSYSGNLRVQDSAGGLTNAPLLAAVAPATVVTVSPTSASLPKLGTQQFSANVGVTWTATVGSISSAGIFTAPNSVTTGTVRAVATDGSGSNATAAVTISAVAVSPIAVTLRVSAVQQFTSNFSATWSASCGTITAFGVYTAPSSPTSCVVTATALNGGSTGTSAVSVVPAPSSNSHGKVKGGKGTGKTA